jgi:putative endonuclease
VSLADLWSALRSGLRTRWKREAEPDHLQRGKAGERAAERHLRSRGLSLLIRNFKSPRGEIDLVMRDGDCLVFVEVKTRSSEQWGRPASAVDRGKRRRLSRAAMDYLRLLKRPHTRLRFDVVEVLMEEGKPAQVRHLPNTFTLSAPYRYG